VNQTIKISIDLTDEQYTHLELNDLDSLYEVIFAEGNINDCCGTIICSKNQLNSQLSFAVDKEHGIYIGIFEDKKSLLSLNDYGKLAETIDVWGDDLLISEGLFIDFQIAWAAIQEYVNLGTIYENVKWIGPDDLPEGGNYI